jgi:hypothetical protein
MQKHQEVLHLGHKEHKEHKEPKVLKEQPVHREQME